VNHSARRMYASERVNLHPDASPLAAPDRCSPSRWRRHILATTSITSRPVFKNYLGNTNTDEVHSLRNGKTNCQINEIITAGHAVTFTPDTEAQAQLDGFDNCALCIGNSTR